MAKRKGISASLRWSVFSRDAFTCRYCGAQAGQDGVELHCDHVVSVAEGGDNAYSNLVTACQCCNGGKGARSLKDAPTSAQVIDRINAHTRTLKEQAESIAAAIDAKSLAADEAIRLKCSAYDRKTVSMRPGEEKRIGHLCNQYGADAVIGWYQCARAARVRPRNAIFYVAACAKNHRARMEQSASAQ